ncbi:MAG: entericidin A/B family lipoprotein [Candidatus Saccharibacteria bacterium]|nr:entericidin A/B family lipoprotein [Moraxellaceae bacterium]
MIKVITAVAFATVMLAGCETMKGAGQDVSSAGHVVTDTAKNTQDKM